MFKKKTQSASKNVRRPGQALDDINAVTVAANDDNAAEVRTDAPINNNSNEADTGSADEEDDDDTTAVRRPTKRQKQQSDHNTATAASQSLNDPTLIAVTSTRSSQPDTSTNAHRHTHYAPKQPPTTTATTTPTLPNAPATTLTLPSTTPAPSARFGPQRASGYARAISRFDYQPDVCVAAGTLVTLANGNSKPIETVQAGDVVLSFDRSCNALIAMAVSSHAKCNGMRECIELLLSNGAVLAVTADHLILTDAKQWVCAGDLVVGHSHVSVAQLAAEKPAVSHTAVPISRALLLAAREVGPRMVYDLSVPQTQQADRSFVASQVVVHNCKDWKECGSCGYGDSCKFLHERTDYKSGWQMEAEWEEQQKQKETKRKQDEERRARGETVRGEASGGGKVGLPFACYICRQSFQQPVVTVCGHYFCERCALARYVKTSRCAVCGKETQGSFSVARELLKENAATAGGGGDGSDEEG